MSWVGADMSVWKMGGLVAALAVAAIPAQAAAPAAAFPQGQYGALNTLPDWGGVWTLVFAPPSGPPPQPKLKGKYLTGYQAWAKAAIETGGAAPRDASNCLPPGMPGIMTMIPQYPIEFLFNPGRVTILHEAWMQWRRIFTDGRSHPEDLDPSFNGHSTGHWEGDTLVIETVGVNDTVFMTMGAGHSDKMRLLERIHLAKDDPDTLEVEMTVDDPEALETPFVTKATYSRVRDGDLLEFVCAENDRNPVDANGVTNFK
jgi:hypothetical protein